MYRRALSIFIPFEGHQSIPWPKAFVRPISILGLAGASIWWRSLSLDLFTFCSHAGCEKCQSGLTLTRNNTSFETLVPCAAWHVRIGFNPMFQCQKIFG